MPTLAEVVRRYGPAYLERFGDRMPAAHKAVLHHIAGCRTGELGTVVYRCEDCGRRHLIGRSCGDRHCPSCQREKAEAWLARQVDRLLPCPYFLVTFTLPAELRGTARSHQRTVYGALFRASSEAVPSRLMADPKSLGAARPGFFGVLHTWGRAVDYDPHVHYVVPGGGLSARETAGWHRGRASWCRSAAVDRLPGQVPGPAARARACWSRWTPRPGDATGWCTVSPPATAAGRCGTWRRTCSGWPSATIGSCRATTAG